jgi:hypothetical protein
MGPMAKWVDDHISFRIPHVCLPKYNARHAAWHHEILNHGGHRQNGSRIWYRGKNLPDGSPKEFDETAPPPLKISQIPPLTPQKTSLCRCRHQPSFCTTWNSVGTIQIGSLQLGGTLSWLSLGPPMLRSVDRSVRLGWCGVCPECQMAEVGKSWTISKSIQRSDG